MLTICQEILDQIAAHAVTHYSDEACGFLIGEKGQDSVTEFIPVRNVYDEMRAKYPETYPRTAKTAYLIDPREHRRVFDDAARDGREVKAIYHSHTDHDAYFSQEDRLVAAPWGEPNYPGVSYIVVSVWDGRLKEINEFSWDNAKNDFVQRKLT
ncbi:MAG TPA: M67 family metallopeptidase [bacterium]|nr:M67 family metallopeptidase [bacterium]